MNKISKSLLGLGVAASLSLSCGIAAAAGNIIVLVNDTNVQSGEEIGIKVVLNGDGVYDAYIWIEGGVLDGATLTVNKDGQWVLRNDQSPQKLRANIDIETLNLQKKIITLLPRLKFENIAGRYKLTAALTTPGQLDFKLIDEIFVVLK
ncbi:hypothetical protein [Candidatus Marithrix sp. Canyon 246]|uniref:hypothetical protein n=1 Tax=Candidatus Marithrix sp. Canyon 246 TaxID=1827136 RepID=UPI00084A027B|nr:hypothetical protein [Candidatus Marithrix sp. Canyon 246]